MVNTLYVYTNNLVLGRRSYHSFESLACHIQALRLDKTLFEFLINP